MGEKAVQETAQRQGNGNTTKQAPELFAYNENMLS